MWLGGKGRSSLPLLAGGAESFEDEGLEYLAGVEVGGGVLGGFIGDG